MVNGFFYDYFIGIKEVLPVTLEKTGDSKRAFLSGMDVGVNGVKDFSTNGFVVTLMSVSASKGLILGQKTEVVAD